MRSASSRGRAGSRSKRPWRRERRSSSLAGDGLKRRSAPVSSAGGGGRGGMSSASETLLSETTSRRSGGSPTASSWSLRARARRTELVTSPERFLIPRWTTSYDEAVNADDVDAVLNLTPFSLHVDVTLAALAAGKHVYSEKPLALTSSEARASPTTRRAADASSWRRRACCCSPGASGDDDRRERRARQTCSPPAVTDRAASRRGTGTTRIHRRTSPATAALLWTWPCIRCTR